MGKLVSAGTALPFASRADSAFSLLLLLRGAAVVLRELVTPREGGRLVEQVEHVAATALPLRHGLTMGELARVLAAEEGAQVEVILTDAPDHAQRRRAVNPGFGKRHLEALRRIAEGG